MGANFSTVLNSFREKRLVPVIAATEVEDDDFDDPVERMLKKTGCLEKHYAVQECIADTKDWRQCQKQVQDFRECIEKSKKTSAASK